MPQADKPLTIMQQCSLTPTFEPLRVFRQFVVKKDGKLVDGEGTLAGASVVITDPKSQSRALSLVGSVDWIQARSGATPFVSSLAQICDPSTSPKESGFAYCLIPGYMLQCYA